MKPFRASSVEILSSLHERYGGYIRSEITSVRILHKSARCYLEVTSLKDTESQHVHDELVERIDLGFISGPSFSPDVSIFDNAQAFVEHFDPVGIINCTPLFTDEAANFVNEQYLKKSQETKDNFDRDGNN